MAAAVDNIEVQRETAAALANISLNEENKVQIARSGCLPALIQLAQADDRERERYAVMTLANVAEMVEGRTQRRMLEEGVLKPLQKLASSPPVDIRRECARAFALFASKRDSHQDLLQAGGLQQMVSFLRATILSVSVLGRLV